MVTLAQVQAGLNRYIAQEFLSKMTGWQKWVFGASAAMLGNNITGIFNQLKGNNLVKMMGIIDDNDNIDLDKLYAAFKEQARQSSVTFDLPVIGATTLNEGDIDKLYSFIKGVSQYVS